MTKKKKTRKSRPHNIVSQIRSLFRAGKDMALDAGVALTAALPLIKGFAAAGGNLMLGLQYAAQRYAGAQTGKTTIAGLAETYVPMGASAVARKVVKSVW